MPTQRELELELEVADLKKQLSQKITEEYLMLKRLYPYMANELDAYRSMPVEEAPTATPEEKGEDKV